MRLHKASIMQTIPLRSTQLRVLHAHVMERAMRKPHAQGKKISIEFLLANPHKPDLHLAAIYWTDSEHKVGEQVYEMSFVLDNGELVEQSEGIEDWDKYTWEISPDGTLRYIGF